jgi:hypothetical protein
VCDHGFLLIEVARITLLSFLFTGWLLGGLIEKMDGLDTQSRGSLRWITEKLNALIVVDASVWDAFLGDTKQQ